MNRNAEGPRPFRARANFALHHNTWKTFCAQCRRRGVAPSTMMRRLVVLAIREAYDPLFDPPEEESRG